MKESNFEEGGLQSIGHYPVPNLISNSYSNPYFNSPSLQNYLSDRFICSQIVFEIYSIFDIIWISPRMQCERGLGYGNILDFLEPLESGWMVLNFATQVATTTVQQHSKKKFSFFNFEKRSRVPFDKINSFFQV